MGLSDFKSEPEEQDSNNEETDQETTENTSKEDSDDLPANHCPECESEGEETEHWYYRCTTPRDECSVITFIKPRENTQ